MLLAAITVVTVTILGIILDYTYIVLRYPYKTHMKSNVGLASIPASKYYAQLYNDLAPVSQPDQLLATNVLIHLLIFTS